MNTYRFKRTILSSGGCLLFSMALSAMAIAQSGSLLQAPSRPVPQKQIVAPGSHPYSGVMQAAYTNDPNGTPPQPNQSILPPTGGDFGAAAQNAPPAGLNTSWTYIPPTQIRQIRLHDIVSIRVDESANSLLLGNATSRKTTAYDAVVRDWIRMVGIDTLKPATQSDGDPRVQMNQNEVYRGDSTLRTSETLTFNIASQVVDILPNGLIVLEGTTTITLNDNSLEISLIGTCRSEDIGADNTVLSRNLVNKRIQKKEDGHVRDGYSRGWFTRVFAKVKPF